MKAAMLFGCLLLLATLSIATGQLSIQGLIRDQNPAGTNTANCAGTTGYIGTDFGLPYGYYTPNEKGLVGKECNGVNGYTNCGRIGADRTPVYEYGAAQSPGKNVKSNATFNSWFHDTPQTKNVPFTIALTSIGNGAYSYSNSTFFPVDNNGWDANCNVKNKHNFNFCFEAHFRFGYMGGETITLGGNDDIWLFVDNKLVIDLGSIHPDASATVNLDNIPGLQKSTPTQSYSYRVDLFYCNRQNSNSKFSIKTTAASPYCAYYDWCGVCEGDGQSCSPPTPSPSPSA